MIRSIEDEHYINNAMKELFKITIEDGSENGEYNIPLDADNIRELLSETYDVFKHQMRRVCKKKNMSNHLLIYLYRQLHSFTKTLGEINNDIFDLTLATQSIDLDDNIRTIVLNNL
jgi:hypothetical protein